MNSRTDISGLGRVVFFNYARNESPLKFPPAIILIRPNETPLSHFYSGKFWENLGVLTLSTQLEKSGIKFGTLEASLFQLSRKRTIELAVKYAPRFVGISVFSTDLLDECLNLASGIKELRKETVTVLGGHGASFVYEDILEKNAGVDIVVRGEAENSLTALTRSVNADDWSTIPNLCFRSGDGIVANAIGPVERDLDKSPLPHRFVREIMSKDDVLSQSPLMMISSKGCFDRCAFCTITKFYSNTWRGRSPAHLVDELEFIVRRYGGHSVHFWDDTFIGPGSRGRKRAIEIANEILRRNLKVTFHVTTRPSDLTEEVIEALAAAGLRSVFIGVESAEQTILDYFGKHAKVEHSAAAIDLLWRHGVHRILSGFIMFHPKTSWETLHSDLDFLDSLPYVEISRIVSRLGYYPGSQFWLENKSKLDPDSYKTYAIPPLCDERLEELYRCCLSLHNHTLSLESALVCLEEQYLPDTKVIDFMAKCRTRLFHLISNRVRLIMDQIQNGSDFEPQLKISNQDVYNETMKIIAALRKTIPGGYLPSILKAHQLDDSRRLTRPPGRGKQVAGLEAHVAV